MPSYFYNNMYGTNHPQLKQRTRAPRVSHAWHFIVAASHACKFDDGHAVTRTRSFCTRGNTHTQFLHTR